MVGWRSHQTPPTLFRKIHHSPPTTHDTIPREGVGEGRGMCEGEVNGGGVGKGKGAIMGEGASGMWFEGGCFEGLCKGMGVGVAEGVVDG